ncbi:hypothetical protein [Mycobacterium sp.]|uniref:hypothetical protein n=1 Tax=Mycobacterium sp. TaxID=1785 RepID=UPI002BA5A036|nr:hypothetical protein [Mycobacterium sp.]HTQ22405.1 hypothetical protein [Mycobacterium sp.]
MPNLTTTTDVTTTPPVNADTVALDAIETRPTTLITEQEVVFSTAVALSPSTRQQSRGARIVAAVRSMFALSSEASGRERRYAPRRYGFLENSLMSREMDRL